MEIFVIFASPTYPNILTMTKTLLFAAFLGLLGSQPMAAQHQISSLEATKTVVSNYGPRNSDGTYNAAGVSVASSATAALTLSDKFYRTGANIHLHYEGAPLNTDAWVGIYKENHTPGTNDVSVTYEYTSAEEGSWDFSLNTTGAYFAVLFGDGGYSEISPRCYFVVSDNCDSENLPSISTDKQIYAPGEPVVVKLNNAPCIQNDWVGLYDSTVEVVKDGKSYSYDYAGTDPFGEVTLNVAGNYNFTTPVGDGVYYVTYCIDNEYFEPTDRSYLVVGKPVVIECGSKSYTPSDDIVITYEGAPAWESDKLIVYSGTELVGEYAMGSTDGTVSIGQLPAGEYEACAVTLEGAEISERLAFEVALVATSSSWMASLSDLAYLHQVSVPGTHDAGTGHGTSMDSFARTQELNIAEQFAIGIRAFDLRPAVKNGALQIYHGIVATKISFEEALDELCRLLDENPTEYAIVVMRHENDGESSADKEKWNGLMEQMLTSEKYAGRFIDFSANLTVDAARGKILILSRDKYSSQPVGGFITGWSHSASFADQGNGVIKGISRLSAKLYMQDFFETHNALDTKVSAINTLLDYSASLKNATQHVWVMNNTSGYSSSLIATADSYRLNAATTNKAFIDHLNEIEAGPTGIVMMDFAGVDKSGSYEVNGLKLVNAIIDNNFNYVMRGKQSVSMALRPIPKHCA